MLDFCKAKVSRKEIYLAVAAVMCCAASCQSENSGDRVCFSSRCVEVEIVKTPEALTRGLQFRKSMEPGHGMLFVFPHAGVFPFWMKDTLIALDMIWIDEKNEIVHIERNVPPCKKDPCPTYDPHQEASYVVEVNAGEVQTLGIKEGGRADFRLKDVQ